MKNSKQEHQRTWENLKEKLANFKERFNISGTEQEETEIEEGLAKKEIRNEFKAVKNQKKLKGDLIASKVERQRAKRKPKENPTGAEGKDPKKVTSKKPPRFN